MLHHNLLRQYDLSEDEFRREMADVFNTTPQDADPHWLPPAHPFRANHIITGRILDIIGDEVLIDVGYKSEGVIPLVLRR